MPNLLIVEDNLEILEMLLTILGRYFNVHTSTNGKEALHLVRQIRPELAILDINIPGIDGLSLCKLIKDDPEIRHIRIIILTAAYADENGKTLSMAAGADAFLTKPVKSQVLLEHAHALLGIPFPKA